MKKIVLIILGTVMVLSGCYSVGPGATVWGDPQIPSRMVKLTALGYGSASSFEGYSTGQKRLMAMRASKLDAYRALAEQVQGVRVTGSSTVSAMMVQNDSFRVYIDAYVRGARVVAVTPIADGNYETTIELDFDEQLVRSHLSQWPGRGGPAVIYQPAYGVRGVVGPGAVYGSSFYYAEY